MNIWELLADCDVYPCVRMRPGETEANALPDRVAGPQSFGTRPRLEGEAVTAHDSEEEALADFIVHIVRWMRSAARDLCPEVAGFVMAPSDREHCELAWLREPYIAYLPDGRSYVSARAALVPEEHWIRPAASNSEQNPDISPASS